MLSAKMIDSINQLLARSGIRYTKNPVADDFMNALFKAEGKKAGNPEFDPALHDFSEDNSFWLGCRDRSGKLIATIAARRIETETFLESCRNYRLWYGDTLRFTESLDLVDGPYDRIPHGRTSFLGGAWVRPDWRGRGLSWALTRLCYYLAIEQWRLDWLIAMVFSGIAEANMPSGNYGFPRGDLFATNYRLLGFSRQRLFLLTMTAPEAMALAETDSQFLEDRPYLTIDTRFGDELRTSRHSGKPTENPPPLKIAI